MSERGKKPVVLLTHPQDQIAKFSNIVSELGCDWLAAPMLKIQPVSYDPGGLPSYQGLIFTSANALRFFVPHKSDYTKPVACVGQSLANLLRQAGFSVAVQAQNVEALAALLCSQNFDVSSWLYVRGQNISYDLKAALHHSGAGSLTELCVYNAIKMQSIPAEILMAIDGHNIDIVTFFSSRTAQAFMEIMTRERRLDALKAIRLLCIRETVLEYVQSDLWQGVYVSDAPTQDGMAETLREILHVD